VSVQYPSSTRTNYNEWSLLMKVNLQAQGLWHAIEPEEEDEIEYRDDRLWLAAILRAVPPEMLASLATKRMAQSAWEAIKSRWIGVQRVRDANAEQLRKEFDHIWFKDEESVDDFSMRLTGLANNIAVLGGKITEAEIVKKLLHVALEPLEQVTISIKMLLDLENLTVEEVTGHLRNIKQRKKTAVSDRQARLLLTEEEWWARMRSRNNAGEGGDYGGSVGGSENGEGVRKTRKSPKLGLDGKPIRCSNCGKKGHLGKDCWSKPKKGKAHLAQTEELEESSLFLASVSSSGELFTTLEQSGDGRAPSHDPPSAAAGEHLGMGVGEVSDQNRVDLKEENVFAQIDDNGEHQYHRRWVLDTGATNHMIGARAAFSELDFRIRGSVKFGDGSVIEIKGRGTILFIGKGGEHRRLTDVYFIPQLKANIVSLGQLEEGGCRIYIEDGFLKICNENQRVLT
jgi:hypothetical protein